VRLVLLALAAIVATSSGACGGDPPARGSDELRLSISFTEPLRSQQPVTWTLEVENGAPTEAVLTFSSGKDGDVVLRQAGRDVYRWSGERFFTQAVRQDRLAAGERKTYRLEEPSLPVAAGRYDLVGALASEPAPPPVQRSVTVEP